MVAQQGSFFEWYANSDFTGSFLGTEKRTNISFDYGTGVIYAGYSDYISAKISTTIKAPATSSYTIYTTHDDGVKEYFDNTLKYNTLNVVDYGIKSFTISLTQDRYYPLYVLWSDITLLANLIYSWSYTGVGTTVIPVGNQYLTELVGSSPYTISSMVSV